MTDLERLQAVLSKEQIGQLIDMALLAYERAVTRQCPQEFGVHLNERGHPTIFRATDDRRGIVPRKVAPLE